MKLLAWVFRLFVFLILLLFAMSNTELATVRLWGANLAWSAPLVLFLLGFFAAGASFALLAIVPTLFRQRREIARLRQGLQAQTSTAGLTPASARGDPAGPGGGATGNGLGAGPAMGLGAAGPGVGPGVGPAGLGVGPGAGPGAGPGTGPGTGLDPAIPPVV